MPILPFPRRQTSIAVSRRLFLLLFAVLLVTVAFAACSGSPVDDTPPPDLLTRHSGNFDTTANIVYKELSATATISRTTPQACSITFSSPPSLEDMAFVFRQDAVDMSYKGISFTFDPDSMPGGAIANVTVSAINKAMRGDGLSVDYTEGILTLSGVMESGAFTLRLDPNDGNLVKLSVPAEELEIEFVNFTFLD